MKIKMNGTLVLYTWGNPYELLSILTNLTS
jgi:hypothetical protein